MVWRTSHHSPIFLASEAQQRRWGLLLRLTIGTWTEESWKPLQQSDQYKYWLCKPCRSSPTSFNFLLPAVQAYHYFSFTVFAFNCNSYFYFPFQLIFQHLINFSHNSFYIGNYCVSFTRTNLTLDPRFLFLHFYFSVWLKNSRTNPTGLWWMFKTAVNYSSSLIIVWIYICPALLLIYIICLRWNYLCMLII